MVKQKKLVPKRRFEGFDEEWEVRRLREQTSLITKGTTPKEMNLNGNVNFIKVENLKNGEINSKVKISNHEHDNYLKRSKLQENDILFSIAGTLGRIAIVNKKNIPANTNQALAIIRGYNFETNFLFTTLGGPVVKKYIKENPTIGAQPNLSLEQVGNLKISTPDIKEQQKVGQFFKHLDEMIALQQRKKDKTKALKSAYLAEMFPAEGERVPKRRFEGFNDEWEERKLIDLGDVKTGSTPPTNDKNNYSKIGMIWVTPTDINSTITTDTAKKLSKVGVALSVVVPPNTILVTSIASIGKNTLVKDYASFNQQINSLSPREEHDSYFLLTQSYYWSKNMKKIAGSGTMQIVNKKMFSHIHTFVPRLEEQKKIGQFFKHLDEMIATHQQKLEKLKATKQGYLHEMFV